jgi:hypothetical protein
LLGLLALLAMGALVALRPAPWQIMLTSTIMAASLVCCTSAGYESGRVLPDGRAHLPNTFNNVAYIDASHLEAYSGDLWNKQGIAGLLRTLMRQGYLPLLASDLTSQRLERAGLLISIAPARQFSGREGDAVREFVGNGGTFICMVGAEEARANAPLLADFNFAVPPSPVPPGQGGVEPEPLGAKYTLIGESNRRARFYAAWPVECTGTDPKYWSVWSDGKKPTPVVASQSDHGGVVVVIGDTQFGSNENFDMNQGESVTFWRWLLSNVVAGQKPWTPPPADKNRPVEMNDSEDNDK